MSYPAGHTPRASDGIEGLIEQIALSLNIAARTGQSPAVTLAAMAAAAAAVSAGATYVALSDKSTTGEAQAGANNTHWMTPLRTKQAIDALAPTGSGGGFPATTASVLYVDSLGNNSTGVRGNPSKPYLTGTAAYAAASNYDTIKFGKGSFSLTTTGAWKGVQLIGSITTSLDVTINACTSVANGFAFQDISSGGTCVINGANGLEFLGTIEMRNAYVDMSVNDVPVGFTNLIVRCFGNAGLGFTTSGDGTAGSVTGSATIIGGYSTNFLLKNAASTVELYIIGGGTPSVAAIYSNGGTTLTGEINASEGYGLDLKAATIRVRNSAYTNLDAFASLIDGGGNTDETADILNGFTLRTANGTRLLYTPKEDGSFDITTL